MSPATASGRVLGRPTGPRTSIFSRSYTRDYRDLHDLRRILTALRELGCDGWIDYKRDCDTARGPYGRGALYWYSPPGTPAIRDPRWSVGREMDREAVMEPVD